MGGVFHRPKKEKKLSLGEEHPDKTFYVIGKEDMIGGGWSLLLQILMHIAYAVDKGYIPIVDMKNYRNQYVTDQDFKNVNIWEKFFEQPMGYTLDDIKKSKNVIISSSAYCPDKRYNIGLGSAIWDDEPKLVMMREIFRKYIRFSQYTKDYLDKEVANVCRTNHKIIGVLCRGTDYIVNKPAGHDIQPDSKQVINDVRIAMETENYDAIFLATEDQDIYEDFVKAFGNKVLSIDQTRISKKIMKGDAWLVAERVKQNPNEDKDKAFLSYFSSTYILSKCRGFYSGRNGGSVGVLLLPNNFSKCKVYNLGIY